MQITMVLGADGARWAHDVAARIDEDDELIIIAPTVRGHVAAGLRASPDLDALLCPVDLDPTYAVADALEAIGYIRRWQRASDQAMAARLVRTDLATIGTSLTDATMAAAGRAALPYRLLPMCEERAEFHVVIGDDEPRAIHLEEYLDDPDAHEPTQLLLIAEQIRVSAAVSQALRDTDVLVLGPSSRTLVIDPVLRVPGFLELVPDELPVLVVECDDPAPTGLIDVAGLRQPDPGAARLVAAGNALERARELVSA